MEDIKPKEAEISAVPTAEDVLKGSGCNDGSWNMTDTDKLPPEQIEVRSSGEGAEVADESMAAFQMQNPLPTGQPLPERTDDGPMSSEQYIPLVELMQSSPNSAPPRPPPPMKARKVTKGRKGKGCYNQLAEDLAVELQAINEKLVNQKLRSLEVSQAREKGDMQELPGLEEDSYVFVSQQGDNQELFVIKVFFNIFVVVAQTRFPNRG